MLFSESPSIRRSDQNHENNFFQQLTSLQTSSRISFNPFYSQEEFTYNQDPIVINHDTNSVDILDNNDITETVDDDNEAETQQFSIRPRGERYIDSVYLGVNSDRVGSRSHTSARSVDFDKILSERLSQSHAGESIKLVNTIEYSATDYKGKQTQVSAVFHISNFSVLLQEVRKMRYPAPTAVELWEDQILPTLATVWQMTASLPWWTVELVQRLASAP